MKTHKSIIILFFSLFITANLTTQTPSDMARKGKTPYDYGLKRNKNYPNYTGTARDYARRRMYKRGYSKKRYSGASKRRNMRSYRKYKSRYKSSRSKRYSGARKYYSRGKQYRVLTAKVSAIALQNQLNRYAKKGWRLVAVMRNKIILEK